MIRKIKNRARRFGLRRRGIDIDVECPVVAYGTASGAWRVCPVSLDATSVVYSFGVGRDLSFDRAVIERHGGCVHAFDPTPASVQWVASQTLPSGLVFHELGIADFDGKLAFHAPRKATSAHFTPIARYRRPVGPMVEAPVSRLTTIMKRLGHDRIDLLKIDIEGGEYAVISDIVCEGLAIGQLLVEFHHNYATIPVSKTVDAIDALRRTGFHVFAISDRTYEISLIHESAMPVRWRDDALSAPCVETGVI